MPYVAAISIIFMIWAWRAGVVLVLDKTKMRGVITASVTFSALPSVLLGVIALSGSLALGAAECDRVFAL